MLRAASPANRSLDGRAWDGSCTAANEADVEQVAGPQQHGKEKFGPAMALHSADKSLINRSFAGSRASSLSTWVWMSASVVSVSWISASAEEPRE